MPCQPARQCLKHSDGPVQRGKQNSSFRRLWLGKDWANTSDAPLGRWCSRGDEDEAPHTS